VSAVPIMVPTRGTVDFRYDTSEDIVYARPRWTLETAADVTRWYEMHVRYFGTRFRLPKDMITVQDNFHVAPEVFGLWQRYCVRLQESLVRFAAYVTTNPRVDLGMAGSGMRHSAGTIETKTVAEAVSGITDLRAVVSKTRTS